MKNLSRIFRAIAIVLGFTSIALGVSFAAEDEGEIENVVIGMYINNIFAIDVATYSYGMDFYIWFRWHNKEMDPSQGFEFMNMFDPDRYFEDYVYDEPQLMPDGSLYQIIRYQGFFISKFPLRKYPFDRQVLKISVEDADFGSDELRYVPDEDPITMNSEILLPGYNIGKIGLSISEKDYPTYFGDLTAPEALSYSRVEFNVPISRPSISNTIKNFLPLVLIILSATFAFLLDPSHVEARVGLGITALLTLVAMQITAQSRMPEVSQLMLMDQVYILSFIYILTVIVFVIITTRGSQSVYSQSGSGKFEHLSQAGPVLALVFATGYVLALSIIVAVNLSS